ncbi:two-component sensor histidine kinase [Paenibacillus glucanolyticus]|uniref:histidine kinase n=2 Tax=Paenibacillus TaxID=44249 RepID=A0A163LW91_9BACL|nr:MULTISPECIES: HAMP domain-containing sensor histidine kinase [Paenibacillus]KZS48524.1 two-component sensor histidine kinase [Paenibacillus glucanolyticus]MDH6672151.1 signal transduction histidine kinase [Paenibacillus sp. LBL]
MKFWHKIYLSSILSFVFIFNAACIMVIERNHSKMLQQEINSGISQNMNIHSSVNAIVPTLRIYDSIDYEKTVLTNIAKEFVEKNVDQHTYMDIMNDKGQSIFSNTDFKMPSQREELDKLAADEIKYILRDIDGRTLLFTTNITDINHKNYVFTYIKDISLVYQERLAQYSFFIRVDMAAVLLYMIIMFFISRGLTKPIKQLNQTAQIIAKGNFSERVQLKSKDEIGVLARNFNDMAAVVEDKINELELHNQEKQRFINNFTHELKTPLTSIIGYANFLRISKYNKEQLLDGLNVIYSEGKRLESLSLKLMDLILLQEDQYQLEKHDLVAIIAEIKSTMELKAREKHVTIAIDCEKGSLLLEKDLIKIVIFNLVDNALKASAAEQIITIRAYWRGSRYVLEVIDQGIGIPKEHQDKIFEPFYVADKSRTRGNNGAGLGLSICQSIARIHHAIFEVSSEENQGTTFRLIFDQGEREGGGIQ